MVSYKYYYRSGVMVLSITTKKILILISSSLEEAPTIHKVIEGEDTLGIKFLFPILNNVLTKKRNKQTKRKNKKRLVKTKRFLSFFMQ